MSETNLCQIDLAFGQSVRVRPMFPSRINAHLSRRLLIGISARMKGAVQLPRTSPDRKYAHRPGTGRFYQATVPGARALRAHRQGSRLPAPEAAVWGDKLVLNFRGRGGEPRSSSARSHAPVSAKRHFGGNCLVTEPSARTLPPDSSSALTVHRYMWGPFGGHGPL
jgi:hypothetical protein